MGIKEDQQGGGLLSDCLFPLLENAWTPLPRCDIMSWVMYQKPLSVGQGRVVRRSKKDKSPC